MNQIKRSVSVSPTAPVRTSASSPAPVPPAQIRQLCAQLDAERDPTKQRQYWTLLQLSAPHTAALDLALAFIMNPSSPNRGEAVRYLRLCYPDRLPALIDAFSHDPDEEMRYQLSEFVRDSDQDAAVGMKIAMLGQASPVKQELLVREIAELGTLFHLEGLQGRDAIAGGNTIFGHAASLLARRVRSHPSVKN